MALFSKRRRWLEWIVIALVLGWIGALAWRHHAKDAIESPPTAGSVVEER